VDKILTQWEVETTRVPYSFRKVNSIELIDVREFPFPFRKRKGIDLETDFFRKIEKGRSDLTGRTGFKLYNGLVPDLAAFFFIWHTFATAKVRNASSSVNSSDKSNPKP
jgi:hypothetical protein